MFCFFASVLREAVVRQLTTQLPISLGILYLTMFVSQVSCLCTGRRVRRSLEDDGVVFSHVDHWVRRIVSTCRPLRERIESIDNGDSSRNELIAREDELTVGACLTFLMCRCLRGAFHGILNILISSLLQLRALCQRGREN